MNTAGFVLGGLWAAKLLLRWQGRWQPARWGDLPGAEARSSSLQPIRLLHRFLAVITGLVLAYCLISALNAAATYRADELRFDYHDHLKWLPHSLDSHRTWATFWNYLALAVGFWAIRDWLLTATEDSAGNRVPSRGRSGRRRDEFLPPRLRRLLWVICINGAVLGLEGLFQRADGTNKLLWLVEPRIHKDAATQFGPYAYRSNAAQYFTLVWPVALGFWWVQRRAAELRSGQSGIYNVLLPCAMLIAACPIFSLSRAGALVAAAGLLIAGVILLRQFWDAPPGTKWGLLLLLGAAIGFGGLMGWEKLSPRMAVAHSEFLRLRVTIWETGWRIVQDYPWFGTGPGTFDSVFQLYLTSPDQYWPAQAHNDWLETLMTFGAVGTGLIALALAGILVRWFVPGGGIAAPRVFVAFVWLALGGWVVHAAVDFPMQIYSLLFLFLLLCSVLLCLSKEPVVSR